MRSQSQQRTAAAQAEGRFDAEIVPVTANDGRQGQGDRRGLDARSDASPRTRATAPTPRSKASPRCSRCAARRHHHHRRQRQPAERRRLGLRRHGRRRSPRSAGSQPLGRYIGMAVAGTEPDEMGIGPVFAVPKLLERFGLKTDDIGLWELNEAFAVQVLYCRDMLGIPDDMLNVDGGAISIGHPYGMTRRPPDRPRPDRRQAPRRRNTSSSPCASAAEWARRGCSRCSRSTPAAQSSRSRGPAAA